MVAEGNPLVVRQQRPVGTEQFAHVLCMHDPGIEVGVVADAGWQEHLTCRSGTQQFAAFPGSLGKHRGRCFAERGPMTCAQAEELIQRFTPSGPARKQRVPFQQPAFGQRTQ